MLTCAETRRNGTRPVNLCGRVEIADHVLFASPIGDEWSVVVNGIVVDTHTNRFAALDLVSRLAQAIRLGQTVSPAPQEWLETVRPGQSS